jgi:alpha-glucosidase (family GH31 glycosyl hydrolase)
MKKIFFLLIVFFFLIDTSKIFSQKLFEGKSLQAELSKGHLIISAANKKLADISSIQFNFTSPKSISILTSGEKEAKLIAVYPGTAEYQGSGEDLKDTILISEFNGGIRFFCQPRWAYNTTIRLNDLNEHYFGVLEHLYPDNNKTPDLRGSVIRVDVLGDANQYHENYASAWSAFYMSSKGYASFFDTFAEGEYRFAINGVTELYHRTGKFDWYIFYGSSGDELLSGYYSVIGKPKYIPVWACGPIIWRDEDRNGKKDVLDDAQKMSDLKIPLTALMVDRPYSNGSNEWSKMDFNQKFSDPKEWISELNNKYHLQFLTWVGPMTMSDKDFPGLFPNFRGYIDLTNPEAVKEFERRLKNHLYSVNVRGHKMDRADEEFPGMIEWYDKTPFHEHRNKYIYLYAKTINKFLQDAYGKDEFNYARAAFHRTQPYLSALWGGDSRSSWDGLAGSIANAIRCGFMGFPVWGSDVGGYLGGWIPENIYARWLEFGTWSGMFEIKLDNAGGNGKDRPPWKYSQKLQDIFRNACSQRMDMLPYIYSAANTSYKNGVLMKPLAYAYPDDKNTYEIWNEYLFGNAFLIAPIYDSSGTRTLYLPKGIWYDFNNPEKTYKGVRIINVSETPDRFPVFIKANSIYVTGNIYQGNEKLWSKESDGELTIHIFPGLEGEKYVYNYVDIKDSNKEKNISIENENAKFLLKVDSLRTDSKLLIKSEVEPVSAKINGDNLKYDWNKDTGIIECSLKKETSALIEIIYK